MIPLEGQILDGLDEFMLRLGHLKVICGVATEGSNSLGRLEREVAKVLTRPVPITQAARQEVAAYLLEKQLCPTSKAGVAGGDAEEADFRYPDLRIEISSSGQALGMRALAPNVPQPTIWWQDLCLASPQVFSRVGAVTVDGKSGSKTGLSHLFDWALALELINKSGQLSAEGHLAVKLGGALQGENWQQNPYVLGNDRLILAYLYFAADVDLFARFAPKLLGAKTPVTKASATELFISTVKEISDEAESARYLSSAQQFRLFQHARELDDSGKRGPRHKVNSTAWHRASSRVETYVDLGFLEKGKGGEHERYKYLYYPGPSLQRAVASLGASKTGREWLEAGLVSSLYGAESADEPSSEDLKRYLPRIVASIGRPASSLPIVPVALGLAWVGIEDGKPRSLAACRSALERFARDFPQAARLSRGSAGERAEFISFDMRRVVA